MARIAVIIPSPERARPAGWLDSVLERIWQRVPTAEIVLYASDPFLVAKDRGVPCRSLRGGGKWSDLGRRSLVVRALAWLPEGLGSLFREMRYIGGLGHVIRSYDLVVVPGCDGLDDRKEGSWGFVYTLFLWSALARAGRVPFVIFGLGVEVPPSRLSRYFLRKAVENSSYCSFRDMGSREWFRSSGTPVRGPVESGPELYDAVLRLTVDGYSPVKGEVLPEPVGNTRALKGNLPLVTVVTPVYNGEAFLAGAIESVLAQDYPNWEYVIINNLSNDRSLEIAESFACRDPRIRVVTNETFVNAEQNHNLAFRQVSTLAGYCKVVSADDRLLPSCLSRMVAYAMTHPSAGVIGSYQRSGKEIRWRGLPEGVKLISGKEACRMALTEGVHVFGNPTSCLYRADLLRHAGAFFPHSAPHADTSACYTRFHECDFGFVHEVLTDEGVHEGQITCQVDELGWGTSAYLETLVDYGPGYLSEDEYASRLQRLLAGYYRYLGGSLLKRKGRKFWHLHTRNFRELGLPLSWCRILWEAVREILEEAANPGMAWKKACALWMSKGPRKPEQTQERQICEPSAERQKTGGEKKAVATNRQERDFVRFSGEVAVRQDLKRRSVQGALFTAGGGVLDFGFRLLLTLVLARLLVPEHFGLLGMVVAVTTIGEQFSSLGLSTATIQVPRVTHQQCSSLFWINSVTGLLFALGVCAVAPLVGAYFHDGRLIPITLAISTNFLWGGLTVQHEALLNRQMKQPQVAAVRLGAGILSGVLAIVLAATGAGYWALVWRDLLRVLVIAAGVWIMCPWIPSLPRRGTKMDGLLGFGRDMTVTQLLIAVSSSLDSLLIGRYSGAVAVGLYRQAYQLMVTPVEQFFRPIHNTAQPGLSMLRAEPERYRRYYERILYIIGLATIPLGVFAAVYAEEIVKVVLGEKWEGAAPFLCIFGFAAAIRPVTTTSGLVLITCGKSGRFLLLAVAHLVVLGIALLIGMRAGAIGIAIAQVAATLVMLLPKLYYSFEGTPVTMRLFFGSLMRPCFAGTAMGLVLTGQQWAFPLDHGLLSLLAGCGTAAVSYFGVLAILPGGYKQLAHLVNEVLSVLASRAGRSGRVLGGASS